MINENLSFDEAMGRLESILDKLESSKDDNGNELSPEKIQDLYEEAEELKGYCKSLLDKEKSEIIRIAKENNIPLEELDFDEFEDDEEDEDDDEYNEDDDEDDDEDEEEENE